MNHRRAMAAALGLLWLVSCVYGLSPARAQELPEPVLSLRVESDLVPLGALKAELEAELGVRIADAATAAQGMPTLSVSRTAAGNVEVTLTSRSLPRASREFALTAERPEDRVEVVALIAANLVRNEAAALLPDLRPVDPTGAPSKKPARPPVRLVDPCDVRGEAVFGIDFAPGVGASSTQGGRNATRRVSLGFAGTLSSRLHGLEFSLGANIEKVSVCGGQVAIGANIALGPVQGVQVALVNLGRGKVVGIQAGIANLAEGDFEGFQSGIVNGTTGYMRGAQNGIANYLGGELRGSQGGVANYIGGDVKGAQGGVANYIGGDLRGLQAGVANVVVGGVTGIQAGVAAVTAGKVEGLQAGVATYAGSVHGLSLGVANISAGPVRGAQIGVFNYADRSPVSIGVLSIQRHGRTSIDALGAVDTGTLTLGLTHGGKYVHNSYGVGLRTGKYGQHLVTTLGLGVRVVSNARLRVDIDAISSQLISNHMGSKSTGTAGVRVPFTVMLLRGFGVVAAPTYQVMISNDPDQHTQSIVGDTKLHSGSTRVLGYPGLTVGLRYEFDHGV